LYIFIISRIYATHPAPLFLLDCSNHDVIILLW
jgi:hypothetical protein